MDPEVHQKDEATTAAASALTRQQQHHEDGDASAVIVAEGKHNNDNNNNNGCISTKREDETTHFPDPDIDNPTVLEVVSWWAEFTSIHGVYYAFERGHFRAWKQVSWLILVLLCTASLIATLNYIMEDFMQYSLNTSIQKVIPASMGFPQVTICNSNMYDTSLQNETGIQEPSNEEELNRISQPLSNFILSTAFNQRVFENITEVWKPVITPFGRCYSFETKQHVFKPGAFSGLQFVAWLEQDNYSETTAYAGLLVFVTERGTTYITDQTPHELVPPGALASLSMQLRNISREREEPWSKCTGTAPMYSNQACRAQCLFAATREFCSCRQIGDPTGDLPYCNSSAPAECQFVEEELVLSTFSCPCQTPPCEEEKYDTFYSSAALSQKFAASFAESFGVTPKSLQDNLVSVTVNYESIEYDRWTESKATSYANLVSDLGGQMGFFMGISLISIVEFFGELLGLRLLPRLWGDKRLYGLGQS